MKTKFIGPLICLAIALSLFFPGMSGLVFAAQTGRSCFPPPAGLTGWWPGDGSTDEIVGGRDAVFHGDATTGSGMVAQAFILDGDGDFVDVPDDPALNVGADDFTVDLWVYFNSTAGEQVLVEKYIEDFSATPPGWTLTKLEDNKVVFENPTHDFPQRIIYWLDENKKLHARVEGTVKGQQRGMEWQWEKLGN